MTFLEMCDAIRAAAHEPEGGWEANDRNPVPPSAVARAVGLVAVLNDCAPDSIDWDAMGGIELSWDMPAKGLAVSVFDEHVALVGGGVATTVVSSIQEAAERIRAIVKGGE